MSSSTFLRLLVRENRSDLAWATLVQVVSAFTQGAGLLLLVPLLKAAGVAGNSSHHVAFLGVNLSLGGALGLYVVAISVAALLNAYQNVMLAKFRLGFVDHLRLRLFTAVAGADWKHLLGQRQSDLLSALTQNVGIVGQGVNASLNLAAAVVVVAVQLAVAVRIAPAVTLLAAATGFALTAAVWPLVRRSRGLGRVFVENNRSVMRASTGFLEALKLAKAQDLTAEHVNRFDRIVRRTRRSQVEFTRASSLSTAAQLIVTACVLAVLVEVAITRMRVPIAELLVVVFIFSRVVPQFTRTQQNIQLAAQALPAMQELLMLIDECEAAHEPVDVPQPSARLSLGAGVRLDGVSFTYPDRDGPALTNVSLEIPVRQTTAIVGPSGAGKTTLIDLAIGLLSPTDGEVFVGSDRLGPTNRTAWRGSVGLAPQDAFLFHDTIRANLLWSRPDATEAELWAALDTAAAGELVRARPRGLDAICGDRGTRLSGGERQRIALARALLRQPDLLVLDEATNSLDAEHERAIRDALTALHGGVTILIIAHRLSTVSHADRIVVIDEGRVVEIGTWVELAGRSEGRLRALIDAGAVD